MKRRMHSYRTIYFLSIICIIIVLCYSCKSEKLNSTCNICGKITQSDNTPVAGAIVKINETVQTTTQSNGEYCFDNLEPGKYDFSVSKTGFTSIQQSINVHLEQQEQNFIIDEIIARFGEDTVINITHYSATAIGFITDLGYLGHVVNYGHCWSSMNPSPTEYDSKTVFDSLSHPAQFSSSLTSLSPNTTYYVRTYAINSHGTAYGNTISFVTNISAVPTLTTTTVSTISQTSALCGGNITDIGGSVVTARGVCWSTAQNPVLTPSHFTTNGSGPGSFVSLMEGLNPNTTYYIRAYATNEGGTAYGNQISVTLWLNQTGPQLTDYDGNTYNSVKIGNQIWMRTNLKTTHYRDGSPIPLVTGNSAWAALSSGAYCNYNNDVATVGTYGRLYNFYAVADSRNICPSGWHVPSDVEWTTLFDYLGGQNTVADKLRETGTTHWTSPNPGATNISGFTALPAGERSYIDGTFGQLGTLAEFWSSTSFSSSEAWDVYLYYTFDNAVIRSMYKGGGFSIRCVKD